MSSTVANQDAEVVKHACLDTHDYFCHQTSFIPTKLSTITAIAIDVPHYLLDKSHMHLKYFNTQWPLLLPTTCTLITFYDVLTRQYSTGFQRGIREDSSSQVDCRYLDDILVCHLYIGIRDSLGAMEH